ncbi:hypothetical protein H4R19_002877 [Coemansia spiralis]|nr:hypothetical protein H4R19_002877 [Coemansia spiralis]
MPPAGAMDAFLAGIPELCNDDQRAFLCSDFDEQRADNPDGYREAIKFWTQLLLDACRRGLLSRGAASPRPVAAADSSDDEGAGDDEDVVDRIAASAAAAAAGGEAASVLCLERNGLAGRLAFRGDTPMGVDAAVEWMQRQGTLEETGAFLAGSLARRWAGRLALQLPLVGRRVAALAWAAAGDGSVLVARPLVEAAAGRVLDTHYAQAACALTDNLMSIDEFRARFARALGSAAPMADIDAQVLIRQLSGARHVATAVGGAGGGQTLVKFAAVRAQPAEAVGAADRGAFQVLATRALIAQQVDQLSARIRTLDDQARTAVRCKQRAQALAHLSLKRHIEGEVIGRRLQALQNIERVVLQLQQSSSDIQLMSAFTAGTCALRGLNQQAELLNPESVFDEWAEQALRAEEIQAAMDDAAPTTDDAELEAQLDALLQEQEEAAQKTAMPSDPADALADALSKVAIAQSPREQTQEPTSEVEAQESLAKQIHTPHEEVEEEEERTAVPAA